MRRGRSRAAARSRNQCLGSARGPAAEGKRRSRPRAQLRRGGAPSPEAGAVRGAAAPEGPRPPGGRARPRSLPSREELRRQRHPGAPVRGCGDTAGLGRGCFLGPRRAGFRTFPNTLGLGVGGPARLLRFRRVAECRQALQPACLEAFPSVPGADPTDAWKPWDQAVKNVPASISVSWHA